MTAENKIIALLREARYTLETWKDVVPAVSLCADIDKALARASAATVARPSEEAESYKRMFSAACYDLGLINEELGLDPDEGGAEPIIAAIRELRRERDNLVDDNCTLAAEVARDVAAETAAYQEQPTKPTEHAEPGADERSALTWSRSQITSRIGQQHKLEGTGQTYTFITKEDALDFIDGAIQIAARAARSGQRAGAAEDAARFVFMIDCALADLRGDDPTPQQQALRASLENCNPKTMDDVRACIDEARGATAPTQHEGRNG